MLFLLFQLGGDRYAIDATQVAEVLPILQLKLLPDAPPGIAGLINYRGQPVPVVDLSLLALGRPAELRRSTRLILVRPSDERLLALVAEQATETGRFELAEFVATGVNVAARTFLGPVATDREGRLVQRVAIENLLPDHLLHALALELAKPS